MYAAGPCDTGTHNGIKAVLLGMTIDSAKFKCDCCRAVYYGKRHGTRSDKHYCRICTQAWLRFCARVVFIVPKKVK